MQFRRFTQTLVIQLSRDRRDAETRRFLHKAPRQHDCRTDYPVILRVSASLRIRGSRFGRIGLEPSTLPPSLNISNLFLHARAVELVAIPFERACPCGGCVLRATEARKQVTEVVLDSRVARQCRGGAGQ